MKLLATLLATGMLFCPFVCQNASTVVLPVDFENEEIVQPRLFTYMDVTLRSINGQVEAIASNIFTFLLSDVQTYILLYSSIEKPTNYNQMILLSSNYVDDLDMGQSISTSYAFDGVTRYWIACVRYREGTGEWQEKYSDLMRTDGVGNVLSPF